MVQYGDCAEIEKVLDGWDRNALACLSAAERCVIKASRIRDGWLAELPTDQALANLRELARDDVEWCDYG